MAGWRRWGLSLLGMGLLITPVWADDSLDYLFDQPSADEVAAAPKKTAIPQVNQAIRPFGSVSFNLAAIRGEGGRNTATLGVDSTWTLGIDARPDDTLRIQGSLSSSLPTGNVLQYSTPMLGELFADYTVGSWAVFRLGQFGVTWGQARLVSNVGNLIASANPGFSVKGAFPLGTGTLTLFSSAIGGFDDHQLPSDFQYASSIDQTLGPVTVGAAWSFRKSQVWQSSAFAKTSFWGWDWYGEAVGTFNQTDSPWDRADAVVGGNWQGWFPVWSFNAETLVSKFKNHPERTQYTSQASVSIDGKVPWSGFSPKATWAYAWDDRSGQVVGSVVYQPAGSSLSLTVGVPWIFGDEGTRFVLGNPDSSGRRYGIGLKASLSYSF